MRSALLTLGSIALTTTVIGNAYFQKKQFYPSVVYITKSNPSMAVIYLQAFVFVLLMGKLVRKVFFGQLRAAEMEHLIERSWYAVTETCLAFTVFREDFSPKFVALFTLLLFLKCFHWLAEDRVDYMERSPVITWLFHIRVVSLLLLLGGLDNFFIGHAYHSTLTKGASVQLVFGFEYAILFTVIMNIFVKYILHTIDLQRENPWENKAVYLLYTELLMGFLKVAFYLSFMFIMIKIHTFPLFAIRPMYMSMRAFKKAVNDVIMSRRAIRNMNTLYPDATAEELASSDNVCIICRDEMIVTTGASKKLPCNHIFHSACLRSWFQRQQTCPTCRMDVLRLPLGRTPPAAPPNNNNNNNNNLGNQQPQAPVGQGDAGVPNQAGPIPNWPGMAGAFPFMQFQMHQPGGAGSAPSPPTATGSGASPHIFMPPPFFPPFCFLPPPPPLPVGDLSGLSPEELSAMEGRERENVEARIRCLRDIQTLLDAAVLHMQQYSSLVQTLRPPESVPPTPSTSKSQTSSTDAKENVPPKEAPAAASSSTQLRESPEETDAQADLRRRRLQRFNQDPPPELD